MSAVKGNTMHSTTSDDSHLRPQQCITPAHTPTIPGTTTPPRKPPQHLLAHSLGYRRRAGTRIAFLLVLALLLAAGITFSLAPGLILFTPRAAITLTPRSALGKLRITVEAVAGTPHPGQAQARFLTTSTQTSRSTVRASGSGHLEAEVARGQVTFYNLATYSIALPAGVTLTGHDGVQIVTDSATLVPAGNPPYMGSASVPAQAVRTGPSGNIAAGDIDVLCCAAGIVVKNQQAFGGGRDARTFTVVAKSDINTASAPLVASLTQQAQAALTAQVHPGEQAIPPTCSPHMLADPQVGQEAAQVTVSVSVTCRSATYNRQQVALIATTLFQQQESAALGPNYASGGQVTSIEDQARILDTPQETLTIPVGVRGLWIYQVDRSTFRALAAQLAGKNPTTARAILLRVPGVAQASIHLSGWNTSMLPLESNQIEIVVFSPHMPGA